jgi:hypothetical protein
VGGREEVVAILEKNISKKENMAVSSAEGAELPERINIPDSISAPRA